MQEVERAKARKMAIKQNSKLERQKSSDRSSKTPSVEAKKQENSPGKTIQKTPSTETKKLEKLPNKTLSKTSSIENKKLEK